MHAVMILLALDKDEQFQYAHSGGRMLVERIELRRAAWAADGPQAARLHGWTVPAYGDPFNDERVRLIHELPEHVRESLQPHRAALAGGNQ